MNGCHRAALRALVRSLVARGALAVALAGCTPAPSRSDAGPPPASSTASDPVDARASAILLAEQRRDAAAITQQDQQSRSDRVRRAAARALARIGGEGARAGLLRALGDEDREVVAWAAYGLGFSCKGHEHDNVSALVARALSLAAATSPASVPEGGAATLDPARAIARAVGRCAADESEPTLVAWLGGSREIAVEAAFALGDLAGVKHKLREETLVALMNLAAGSASAPPVAEGLFPVGRLENIPSTAVDRVREVAAARLATPGDARLFAVRALGRAGPGAAHDLARVLASADGFTSAERAEAARALKRLDKAGARALAEAIAALAPSADPVALTGLVGDASGVLLSALDSLASPAGAEKPLRDLAALPLPPAAPPAIARRIAWIRCAAAKVLAGPNFREPLLAGCDAGTAAAPDGGAPASPRGSIGARAMVDVIGRAEIAGARLVAWRALATGGDLRAREAAIALLGDHEEVPGASAILAEALGAKERGVVATAADVIAKHPERAVGDAPRAPAKKKRKHKKHGDPGRDDKENESDRVDSAPSAVVVSALLAALGSPSIGEDPEVIGSVIDAAGALALKAATPRLEAFCKSAYPTDREHAEKALGLTATKRSCGPTMGDAPAELDHLAAGRATLTFDTDAGALTMTLDPAMAPVTVTRILELARSGYYDGGVVHRAVPGFVAQFGAPDGDGYGGPPGKPPLRCETSPIAFEPLAIGVALSGRDTGSSQLFVLHARYPHLDGQYAWLGTAGGAWTSLVDGDVIHAVKVSP